MSKVWFFGDSFCANNDNWVAQVANNINCSIASLGAAGTSIEYLAESLIENRNAISAEDYVVVCIPDYPRHYFRGVNFRISNIHNPDDSFCTFDKIKGHFVAIDDDMVLAYRSFIKYLYTDEIYQKTSFVLINHIINDILPSFATKKVVYFFSMADDVKTFEFFKQNQSIICKPLMSILRDFLENRAEYTNLLEVNRHDYMSKKLQTNNHFVEDPEYYKLFWKEVNPVLKLIEAQTEIF